METLKYKIIKNRKQYNKYCGILEELVSLDNIKLEDEIELLTFLIEKWDEEHNSFSYLDPIELIKVLMKENGLKAKDLVEILGLTKGTVSKILNYQKGLSKESIRKLSSHFDISQELLNRPYELINKVEYSEDGSLVRG